MTDDATRQLLIIHTKDPERSFFAALETGLSIDAALAAYRELLIAGLVKVGKGTAIINRESVDAYQITPRGFELGQKLMK